MKKFKLSLKPKSVINTDFKFTFIDLFCGIGGFHVAMKQLGGQCVFASDIDQSCRNIYKLNHGLLPIGDIRERQQIPPHDILCAGFPCQPFSNGGNKKAFEDKRGLLFDQIVDILREYKTPFAILENVKHIKKVSNGNVYEYIYNQLNRVGYKVFDVLISPKDINIPQNRERVIFLVIRNDLHTEKTKASFLSQFELNKKVYHSRNDNMIIYDTSPQSIYNISCELGQVIKAWGDFITICSQIGDIISPVIPEYFTTDELLGNSKWKNEYIKKNNIFYQKYKSLIDPWYDKNKTILTKKSVYGKLEWQTGGIRECDSIYNYFIQIRQSGVRVKKTDCFPALVAIVQTPIIASQGRYLTPRECARLQSLPDDFVFGNQSDKLTYKQLGNGVNVDIIKLIGDTLIQTYTDYFNHKTE